ncbi:MAG TPA: prepilin-type N-terminal cleavage/methylation domain-containing protein [Usitatibacter sp.]
MTSQRGFTLIELVVAMALLGTMMVLMYSGLSFSLKGWDTGAASGQRITDRRIGENFLRRELSEIFPMRWKDPMVLRLAFEGEAQRVRFVSSRPAGVTQGGLSLVGLEVEAGEGRERNLVMRRAMPDDAAKDFGPLDQGDRAVLLAGVDSVAFSYFGSENDFTDPRWSDTWTYAGRVPQMVRMRVRNMDGTQVPEMVVRVNLGEEAGCLENSFQRVCRPRRPA